MLPGHVMRAIDVAETGDRIFQCMCGEWMNVTDSLSEAIMDFRDHASGTMCDMFA